MGTSQSVPWGSHLLYSSHTVSTPSCLPQVPLDRDVRDVRCAAPRPLSANSNRIPLRAVRCTCCSRTRSHASHTPTQACTHARTHINAHASLRAPVRTHLRAVAQLSSFLRFRSSSQRFRVHCAIVRQVQASPRYRCSRPLLAHAMLLRHPLRRLDSAPLRRAPHKLR